MRTICKLVWKDLSRDARHPWSLIVFMIIPVLTATLIGLVFSPNRDLAKSVTVHIAVLDRDDDMLSSVLRSMAGQKDAAEGLRLHFVKTEPEGLRLVGKRQVSAFVVFPAHLSTKLLRGESASVILYKNPAQAILPRVVEEGLLVLCIGVSEALQVLGPEMEEIRDLIKRKELPAAAEVARVSSEAMDRLKTVRPYLLPPLVQFRTVAASEYVPGTGTVTGKQAGGAP